MNRFRALAATVMFPIVAVFNPLHAMRPAAATETERVITPSRESVASSRLDDRQVIARIRAYRERMKLAAFYDSVAESIAPGESTWLTIGRCEQPGSGYGGVAWTTKSSTYSGGLGFHNQTWAQYRLPGMPASAGDATVFDQMRVASVLYRKYGMEPWGCRTAL